MNRWSKAFLVSRCGIALATARPASARLDSNKSAPEPRHNDARIEFNKGFIPPKNLTMLRAAQALAREVTELAVT